MPRDRKSLEDHKLQSTKPQYVEPDSDVAPGRPKYPKNITGQAKSAFKRLVKMLQDRRTITDGDSEVLRLYAFLYDRHNRALEHLALEGDIVEANAVTKTGELYTVLKENLWLGIAQNCETKMAALLTQLGLTPRTRTQVKETKAPKKAEEIFPTREEACVAQPVSDADFLNSIDEGKVM
ncbi:MAG: phage terminase small subunit P27 family [Candidatus Sulfotelmatobacter sp.]